MTTLREEHCRPPNDAAPRPDAGEVQDMLAQIDGWQIDADGLFKEFVFADFKGAMLFASAAACLGERENHRPGLDIDDRRVLVSFRASDPGGVSRNDFICAAKLDALSTL